MNGYLFSLFSLLRHGIIAILIFPLIEELFMNELIHVLFILTFKALTNCYFDFSIDGRKSYVLYNPYFLDIYTLLSFLV